MPQILSSRPEDSDHSAGNVDGPGPTQTSSFFENVGVGGAQFHGQNTININTDPASSLLKQNLDDRRKPRVLKLSIDENMPIERALELVAILNSHIGSSQSATLVYYEEGSTHLFLDGPEDVLNMIVRLHQSGRLEQLLNPSPQLPREVSIMGVQAAGGLYNMAEVMTKVETIKSIHQNKYDKFIDLVNADLSGAMLSGTNLNKANLAGANLSKADLSMANLGGADLSKSNLIGATLSLANLSGASLRNSNLQSSNLGKTNLRMAKLNGATLKDADLSKADLSVADLEKADIRGANLYGATLYGSTLIMSDLTGANLFGADLRVSKLEGADFTGAILEKSLFSYDPSLSHSQVIDMQKRGARFVDLPDIGVASFVSR
jgi:uncharacterized protein YjbI with pentapeptide repeats